VGIGIGGAGPLVASGNMRDWSELDGVRKKSAIGVFPGLVDIEVLLGITSFVRELSCAWSGDEAEFAIVANFFSTSFSSSIPKPNMIDDESIGVSSTGGKFVVLDCAVNADVGVDSDDSEAGLGGIGCP
jgi:hypothetical protein